MMEGPFVRVLRDSLWMVSWLVLMADALKWARTSDEWTALAGAQAWTPAFREVHYYMLRALLVVLLFDVAALLRQTVMAYLVMRFRHKKFQFFASFQVRPGPRHRVRMHQALYGYALYDQADRHALIFQSMCTVLQL